MKMLAKTKHVEEVASRAGANGQRCCNSSSRTLASVLAGLLSVISLAYCIALNLKTTELHERLFALENGKADLLYYQAPGFSMDQLNTAVRERVDQLLSQRSYEHLAKIRIAREAPPECSCPAG
uniref:Uncharacterized protein n=1 Tax=Latimeria chalumnae TaxID=7897 RepID=H3AKF1_LATCH